MATLRLLGRSGRVDPASPRPRTVSPAPDENSAAAAGGPSGTRAALYVVLVLLFAGAWLSLRLSLDDATPTRSPQGGAGFLLELAREPLTANTRQAREVAERVRAAVSRANAALAEDDFAEAVLEYHDALLLFPRNVEALEGLRLAGTRYRERKKLLETLAPAERAFDGGDYQLALQILDRLPPTNDPGFVRRCMATAWYDLGMLSLREGDPDTAVGRFEEALASLPGDERSLRARDFAQRNQSVARDERYLAQVERLGFRRWGE